MSHTGGALPFRPAGWTRAVEAVKLPKDPSAYLKTFYTDTVTPHALGVKWAIEFFGIDHIMFGDDYPCWKTEDAIQVVEELGLSKTDREKIFSLNARRFFNLPQPAVIKVKEAAFA